MTRGARAGAPLMVISLLCFCAGFAFVVDLAAEGEVGGRNALGWAEALLRLEDIDRELDSLNLSLHEMVLRPAEADRRAKMEDVAGAMDAAGRAEIDLSRLFPKASGQIELLHGRLLALHAACQVPVGGDPYRLLLEACFPRIIETRGLVDSLSRAQLEEQRRKAAEVAAASSVRFYFASGLMMAGILALGAAMFALNGEARIRTFLRIEDGGRERLLSDLEE